MNLFKAFQEWPEPCFVWEISGGLLDYNKAGKTFFDSNELRKIVLPKVFPWTQSDVELLPGRHFEVRFRPLGDRHLVGVFVEMTELKKLQAASVKLPLEMTRSLTDIQATHRTELESEKLNHLKARVLSLSELSSGIAHEIHQPLTSILGYTQELLNLNPAESQKDYLNEVRNAAKRIQSIVEAFRSWVRKDRQDETEVDLFRVTSTVLESHQRQLQQAGIVIDWKGIPDSEKFAVRGRSELFEGIFGNLLRNAIDAVSVKTPRPKSPEIEIRLSREGSELVWTILDHGVGISRSKLPHIFDPFFSTKAVGKGMGLGLYLVYGWVESLGGVIRVESEEGIMTKTIVKFSAIAQRKSTN